MKTTLKITPALLLLCLCWCATPALAQSQNAQAVTWFKTGIQESNSDKKIAAYLKALEYDPDFVEVLYNLGLTFKKKQDFRQAEQYLVRALNVRGQTPGETRLRVTYELATVYRRNGKDRQAEEAYRQARNWSDDAALRSTITLELGRFLYEQGNYPEALAELREGQKAGGANAAQFETLIMQVQVESELQRLYDAASAAQTSGNLKQAQSLFEQIKQTRPNYKDVESRLASLSSSADLEKRKENTATLYEQAEKQVREGNLESAVATFERVLLQEANYKDAAAKLEAARKQLAVKRAEQFLEERYSEGMTAHKLKDWTRAIVAFEKVVGENSNFRDARKRLAEAQRELDRESAETVAARYYADGVAAMNRKDMGGALAALEKVQRVNPRYRNVQALLIEVEEKLSHSTTPAIANARTPRTNLDSLYQQGVDAAIQQDWMPAVVAFEKLQILQANYRDVATRLEEARLQLNAQAQAATAQSTDEQDSATWSWAGSAALLFVVPLLGVVLFSPQARARYQMFRGNYAGAMLIYEKQLARFPGRTRLYPPLANLYLLTGRRDEKALKIFKTVLQLNLPMPNRDEINGIVAQQFLTEGRTDSDAIEVLENALKAERQKQLMSGDRQG